MYLPGDPGGITGAYWDVASCLEPLLPTEGTLGIMGLGGGTAAVVRTLVSSLGLKPRWSVLWWSVCVIGSVAALGNHSPSLISPTLSLSLSPLRQRCALSATRTHQLAMADASTDERLT